MQTELDALGGSWRFMKLLSGPLDDLEVHLRHASPTSEEVIEIAGKSLGPYWKVENSDVVARIHFERAWVWHSNVESMALPNEHEVNDGGVIAIVRKSPYLEFMQTFVWLDHPMADGGALYRIHTEDRVIDVFSPQAPVIALGGV